MLAAINAPATSALRQKRFTKCLLLVTELSRRPPRLAADYKVCRSLFSRLAAIATRRRRPRARGAWTRNPLRGAAVPDAIP